MGMTPTLTPAQVEEVYAELHKLKSQNNMLAGLNASLQNQVTNQTNLTIIMSSILFRQLGYIEENKIQLLGGLPQPIRVTQPLIYSISQKKINDLEWLFPGEQPTLGFTQQVIDGETHLVFKLVADTEAQAVDPTLN